MASYIVHNALIKFSGLAYNGYAMQKAGYEDKALANFETLPLAVECADKLHAIVDTGWLVVHSFSENVLYDSRNK